MRLAHADSGRHLPGPADRSSNNSTSYDCVVGLDLAGENAQGDFMDVVAVPLDDPAGVSLIHRAALAGPADSTVRTGCHDAGVLRGSVNLAVCASADTPNVFSSPSRPITGSTPDGSSVTIPPWFGLAGIGRDRAGELHTCPVLSSG